MLRRSAGNLDAIAIQVGAPSKQALTAERRRVYGASSREISRMTDEASLAKAIAYMCCVPSLH
jgi:hypothetical protein